MKRWLLLLLLPAICSADDFQPRPWDDYKVIMWIGDSAYADRARIPLFFQRLREMGINTGMIYGDRDPKPLLDNQFPFYVENIINKGLCLKWNSTVTDWDKFVTMWRGPRDKARLVRDYCLDDPNWLDGAKNLMRDAVRKHAPHNPVAYDIRDELSVTYSANPFDYDFSPAALKGFRDWLKTQYADLASMNREWETAFKAWDDVMPFTSDEIKNRMASGKAQPRGNPDWHALEALKLDPATARLSPTRWNFSPWCDFRTYMDLSLARVLDEIRRAAHEVDPRTPVGIEGTQMACAFGGYDLWRLSQVLDWVEPYDIGNARAILGSFMPGKPFLSTFGEAETNPALRRLWHLVLRGDRGCIVWWSEDCIDWKSPDYALTAKARALAPALKEMTGSLAKVFMRAKRQYDPIAIHYSQTSIQADWLIESCEDGSTWLRRFSSYEAEHNRMAKVRNAWVKAIEDLGYSPQFVSSTQIEGGALAAGKYKLLIMPYSIAVTDKEVVPIRTMLQSKDAAVLADAPVMFNGHGKLRMEDPFGGKLPVTAPVAAYAVDRAKAQMPAGWEWVGERCQAVPREVWLTAGPKARTTILRYRLGSARLVAFERNVDYHMSENLKQAGGNEALEEPVELEAKLAQPAHVCDLRAKKYLGWTDTIRFTLDPWQPALFALLPRKVPSEKVVELLLKNITERDGCPSQESQTHAAGDHGP